MNHVRGLLESHPVIGSVVVVAVAVLFTEIPLAAAFAPLLGAHFAEYVPGMLEQYVAAFCIALVAGAAGLEGFGAYRPPREAKTWFLGWPCLALAVAMGAENMLAGKGAIDAADPLLYILLLLFLSTGFFEEGLFRGFVLPLLVRRWGDDRRGAYKAVIASSLLFGCTHVVNLILGRYDLVAGIAQVLYGTFCGVYFGALALRTGSILPGVILHGVMDFAGNLEALAPGSSLVSEAVFKQSLTDALVSCGTFSLFLFYGLFLLRRTGAGSSQHLR